MLADLLLSESSIDVPTAARENTTEETEKKFSTEKGIKQKWSVLSVHIYCQKFNPACPRWI